MTEVKRNTDRENLVKAAVNNSPYYRHLAMKVVDFTDQGSVMEMEVTPAHINVWGTVHGGALSSLVDSSCGTSIGPKLDEGETVVTIELKAQFLRPVREGVITARGRVVHRTKRYVITESEVFDRDGNLVARGGGTHTLIIRKG